MTGVLLAACGGSSPRTPAKTATPRTGDATPALPIAGHGETAGKPGGVLTVAGMSNPIFFKQDRAGTRLPYADQIDYLILPDRAAALQSLQSQQTAISALLQPDDLEKLRASNPNDFNFMEVPGVSS